MYEDLIAVLEALEEQVAEEQNNLPKEARHKETLSYFEGKKAGLEIALFKARAMKRALE